MIINMQPQSTYLMHSVKMEIVLAIVSRNYIRKKTVTLLFGYRRFLMSSLSSILIPAYKYTARLVTTVGQCLSN